MLCLDKTCAGMGLVQPPTLMDVMSEGFNSFSIKKANFGILSRDTFMNS